MSSTAVRRDPGRELRVDQRRVGLEREVGVRRRSGEQLDDAGAASASQTASSPPRDWTSAW
jgi:hypothetical protein